MIEPALELLEQFLAEYPEDPQVSQTLLQLARCLAEQDKIEEAISTMQRGLAIEARGSCKTNLWIDLAWLIFEHGLCERSEEAQEAIRQGRAAGLDLFPVDQFKAHVVSAWIAETMGASDVASAEAQSALASAQQSHSDFRYHPRAGLVDQPSAEGLLPWLEALAQQGGEGPDPR